jgi:hypothetical protein
MPDKELDHHSKNAHRCVKDMSQSEGWVYLKGFIDQRIDSYMKSIVSSDASNISVIASLQSGIKELQAILDYVGQRVKD